MNPITELLVCNTCRPPGAPRDGVAAGQQLFEAVQALAAADPGAPRVRAVACLSACGRSCSAALQAPGKYSYVFGDLQADAASAADLLAAAARHQALEDGQIPWRERPESLRRGTLARLPPTIP
ncbi:hypothetical protein CLD22_14970 [Rubrivivax gelatinosus]|nr:hypothetical protein [Rubrivivax gelatinosus]